MTRQTRNIPKLNGQMKSAMSLVFGRLNDDTDVSQFSVSDDGLLVSRFTDVDRVIEKNDVVNPNEVGPLQVYGDERALLASNGYQLQLD